MLSGTACTRWSRFRGALTRDVRRERDRAAAWIAAVVRVGVIATLLLAASGCMPVRYVAQAAAGQLEMSASAQSIRDVLADPGTPLRLRRLLLRVDAIKRFGVRHGLVATDSYTTYADLGRPAAVWVVSACAPLRFEPKTWSFPIVGSVPYLGWFHEQSARSFAAELEREGWDADVRTAAAYSTLGWFQDPVLSTMIPEGDDALGELADTVLHESVHATVYVEGQSVLNESVAAFVGERLAQRYLDEEVGVASIEARAYAEARRAAAFRAAAMQAAARRLARLYDSPLPARDKLAEKARILAALRVVLDMHRPPGAAPRARAINNATLLQVRTYHAGADALEALLAACGGSYPRLLAAIGRLDAGDFAAPQQEELAPVLLGLARRGCR